MLSVVPKMTRTADLLAQYAAEFARRGGKARAKNLTAERRRAIAREAARARWAKAKKK